MAICEPDPTYKWNDAQSHINKGTNTFNTV